MDFLDSAMHVIKFFSAFTAATTAAAASSAG
jgi:hypothetical protein